MTERIRVHEDDTERDIDDCVLYQGKPFTGEAIDTAEDGSLVSVYSYFMGFPDGPYQEWYTPEQLHKQGQMRDGRPVGIHREWHPNGQLAVEMEFNEHSNLLRQKKWDNQGNLVSTTPHHQS
ncbi:toxin-antitoxin system YwqK family antitoxin [Goodfellowiella coeruleoviolacea]|uniref:Toxin-antitoxin system YwqK family antitoxin n=1 Tax=Goodfellowiella coeruleoviolacea TaxID=334858 RepID=A0AAE3KKH0_9PSEU|nr:hypothetical protein [Goodfellowiella coeruleoviolacea]MCP2169354.1 hypothetical protein [Goodfellowiella coeruleoviolacea]